MEILGKISVTLPNLPFLLTTPLEVYRRLLHPLLLPDAELVMITLDSLYFLTNHHREVAQRVAIVCGLVDVLVWLLSFRIETLPSSSLAQMKLFFIGDSASLAQYLADIQAKPKQVQSLTLPVSGGVVSVGMRGVVASPLATNQIRSVTATRTGSPLLTNQIVARSQGNSPAAGVKTVVTTVGSSLYSILGNRALTLTNNNPGEEFAIEWYGTSRHSLMKTGYRTEFKI